METAEYNFIKHEILDLIGVDLNGYKAPQMQRRLKSYLLRSGQETWSNLFNLMRQSPTELEKLKDFLTINVTSFFRDTEKFKALRGIILPELLQGQHRLRVWSSGCSRGHESYTLAMLLGEASGVGCLHKVVATDIDQSALAWAKAGGPYSQDEVTNVPPDWLSRYFTKCPDGYYVDQSLKQLITFRQHNLLADPFEQDFDLIVCRNVVIYFTAEVKNQLYRRFYDSLRPGGILFVGGTEFIPKASDIGFETVGISFYRRNGASTYSHLGQSSTRRTIGGK
jgi:chemotaxis protein methyltransferase CheR